MGGAPTIEGGMTKKEQEELLADERRYQSEQEEVRRARAKSEEKEREEAAKIERERLKAEELARVAEANAAEEESIDALTSMEEEEDAGGKLNVDFYGSLYDGVGKKPSGDAAKKPTTDRPK